MSQARQTFNYVLAYLLWAVSTGLGLFTLYRLREVYLLSLVMSSVDPNSTSSEQFYTALRVRAADVWSLFIAGIVLLILLVFFENYYRLGVPQGQLLTRFFLVTAVEMGVLFAAHLISFILQSTVLPNVWGAVYILFAELVIGGIFLWLYLRRRKQAAV